MRGLSGNLTKTDQSGVLRVASENYDAFIEEMDNQLSTGDLTIEKYEDIKEKLDNYILISGDINELLFNEDGSSKVTEERADELVKLITQRNAIQAKMDETDTNLSEEYQKELDNVNSQIGNMKNTIEFDNSLRSVWKIDRKIKKIKQDLKNKEIGDKKKQELKKELIKLTKQQEQDLLFTPEYSIDGKTYNTKEEFLKRIRAHKNNGDFKKGKQLNIKVKNDFNIEKEAYKIMGKYAPKESQNRVVMSNAKAMRIVDFINNRSQFDIEQELRKEELSEKKDPKKIQQLKDALKYFELERANYKFGEKGFLVPKTVAKSTFADKKELKLKSVDAKLKKSIDFVEKYGKEIGGDTKVINTEKKFDALMKKLGIKGTKGMDGFFDPNTKIFYINKEVAKNTTAVNVGAHELLHGIMWSTLNGPLRTIKDPNNKDVKVNITKDGLKLVKQFIDIIKENSQFKIIQERIDDAYRYNEDGGEKALEEYAEEYINVFVDALNPSQGQPAIKFEESLFRKLINLFKNFFKPKGFVNLEFEDGRALYNFLKAYDSDRVAGKLRKSIIDFGRKSLKRKTEGKIQTSKTLSKKTPEELVKIIQRGQNPQRVKEANEALAPQFELLALSEKALNYDTRKGDIAREDVVAEAMTYLPGIIKRYNKKDGAFSTFVIANMKPKRQVIYEKVKPLTYGETTSIDTKEARQVEGDVGTTTNIEDTFVQKIDIFGFATVGRVADKIKSLVKVKLGDTFKNIISRYAGKVGELVFYLLFF